MSTACAIFLFIVEDSRNFCSGEVKAGDNCVDHFFTGISIASKDLVSTVRKLHLHNCRVGEDISFYFERVIFVISGLEVTRIIVVVSATVATVAFSFLVSIVIFKMDVIINTPTFFCVDRGRYGDRECEQGEQQES